MISNFRFQQLSPFEAEDLTSSSDDDFGAADLGAVSISMPGRAKTSSTSRSTATTTDDEEWYRMCHTCMKCKCGLESRFVNTYDSPGFFKHHKQLGECDCKSWTMCFFQTPLSTREAQKLLRKREMAKRKRNEPSGRKKKIKVSDDVFLIGYERKETNECSSSDD